MDKPMEFDQATALTRRLLEGLGGSSNAYENLPPQVEEEEVLGIPANKVVQDSLRRLLGKEPPQWPEDTTETQGVEDLEELGIYPCVQVDVDHEVNPSCLLAPTPISAEYEAVGVVEEFSELSAIWDALFLAITRQVLDPGVHMATGVYPVEGTSTRGYYIGDTAKGWVYRHEVDTSILHLEDRKDDPFVWVLSDSDDSVDYGYLHAGYVFKRKRS